jgi:predicted ATPase
MAVYRPGEYRLSRFRFAQVETGVAALCYRSWVLWLLGYPDSALKDVQTLLQEARKLKEPATLLAALFHACMPELLSGAVTTAEAHGEELLSLAEDKVAPQWRAHGIIIRGRALLMRGQPADAAKLIMTGVGDVVSTGCTHFKPLFLAEMARAHGQCSEFAEAESCISEALHIAQGTREKWAEAEIYRTAGELALATGNPGDAEVYFVHGLSVAREQNAKAWELRIATSLARLWHNGRRHSEAIDLLAGVYGEFTEGFDTLDLREAKNLLDSLAHPSTTH